MRADDPVIAALAAADPHPGGADPVADAPDLARVRERIMATPPRRGGRRRWPRAAGPVIVVANLFVVLVVAALFLHAGGSSRRASLTPADVGRGRIVLRLEPSAAFPRVTAAAARTELLLLRDRVRSLGAIGITVRRLGAAEIVVSVPGSDRVALVTRYLTAQPLLAFTDWEANVVAPDGHTVASESLEHDAAARLLSQGVNGGPGSPDAGAVPLERAVALASRQPARSSSPTLSRPGSEWFAFARTGSGGCRAQTQSCYRAGPTASRRALRGQSGERVLAVPQGTLIAQATSSGDPGADYRDPAGRFFVLRDDVALTNAQLTSAHVGRGDGGASAIDVDFTPRGASALHALTATVARRGRRLTRENPEFQHFAVIFAGSVLTVPEIDYQEYPDGILPAHRTGEIVGGFSRSAAQDIAAEALPLNLRVLHRR